MTSSDALAKFQYRDHNQLPLADLETKLSLARGSTRDALAIAGQALDCYDVARSPRYAWPLLTVSARACAAALTSAAADSDDGLAGRARLLLDRLRALAEVMDAAGPLQQAYRLTFQRGWPVVRMIVMQGRPPDNEHLLRDGQAAPLTGPCP